MTPDPRDRTIARLHARIERLESAWQRTEAGQRAHVEGYAHRRAIMHAARKHAALGTGFLALLAARLREVDTADGVLDAGCARRLVETWSQQRNEVEGISR